jgi:hypothetical protein
MGEPIGNADDFYRLRVIRVDEGEVPDLEWRDDILYRRPLDTDSEEYDVFQVEAVDVDDEERASVLARFGTAEEARAWSLTAQEDLATMTKSEFERTYFADEGADADTPGRGIGQLDADWT